MRVAVITSVPAPYREPIFNILSKNINILVFYEELREGRGWTVLKNANYRYIFTQNPLEGLERFSPSVLLIYGYNSRNAILSLFWSLKKKIPFLMRTDSNIMDEMYKNPLKRWAKKIFLPSLARRASLFLTTGKRNEEFWNYYGAEEEKFLRARYTVEVDYFAMETDRARKKRDEIFKSLSIPHARYILFVGRLVKIKGVEILIKSFFKIAPDFKDVNLLIAGGGPELERLKRLSGELLNRRIFFTGTIAREKIPELFAISEFLVLPSLFEPWGLCVNEAMAGGIPCLVSENCGCVPDLILEGETGWTFKRGDELNLEEKMRVCLNSDLKSMGERARKLSSEVTLEMVAERFLQGFTYLEKYGRRIF